MASQRAIELFALLNFAVVGLSLVVRPLAWARFFIWMEREGEAGAVIYGLMCVLWGSLIVSFLSDTARAAGWSSSVRGVLRSRGLYFAMPVSAWVMAISGGKAALAIPIARNHRARPRCLHLAAILLSVGAT